MADSDFDKITPADLDITTRGEDSRSARPEAAARAPLGQGEARDLAAYQRRNHRILWGIFCLLLVLAGGVIFVLPDYVAPPSASPAQRADAAPSAPPAPSDSGIAPYQEAQLMEQREQAQNILADLLELQDALEAREVETWAGEDFAAAVALATAGDENYRRQDFLQAREHYQQALTALREIDERSADIFERALDDGGRALEQGDPEAALDAFNLALTLRSDNEDAATGLRRAGVLDQVLALLEAGRSLQDEGELQAARERYQQALAADPQHGGARGALKAVEQAITERNFSDAMSQGYARLRADEPEAALAAFERARDFKPDSGDAQAALEQTRDQITSSAINRHLRQAREHEHAERWEEALAAYEAALAIDANVVDAAAGRDRAQSRNNLDQFLQRTIDEPLRLAEDAIYQQTRQVYQSARNLPGPGPRLAEQLDTVGMLLEKARQPVAVGFESDGLTEVTVYKVGTLGRFTRDSLALTPGTYIAVGVRDGYRDVRREFTVSFDGQPPVVSIACEEEIL